MTERIRFSKDTFRKFRLSEPGGHVIEHYKLTSCMPEKHIEQILENQKIVDVLIQKYNRKIPEPEMQDSMQNDAWRNEQFHLEHYIRLATGKDIKEIL